MEKYRGILTGIFITLALIAPTVIAIRAFITAFSGSREKQKSKNKDAGPDNAENPEQEQNPASSASSSN